VESDGRKPIVVSSVLEGERHAYGAWTASANVSVGIKASARWNLRVGPTFTRAFLSAQYIGIVPDPEYTATFGQRYLFTPLEQTELGLETRFNVTFTPRLSLETYAQPLLSSADFGDGKQFVAPKRFDFVPYAGEIPNFDFNLRSLRGNAVLRWEWRQGSTMYLAWQQRRENIAPYGDFSFSRDRRALFGTRPDNIFVVKVNYWVNL